MTLFSTEYCLFLNTFLQKRHFFQMCYSIFKKTNIINVYYNYVKIKKQKKLSHSIIILHISQTGHGVISKLSIYIPYKDATL